MRTQSPTLFAVAFAAGLAQAQLASVSLTHDDSDGIINVGETVTWTLAIELISQPDLAVLSEVNIALGSTTLGLLETATFEFTPFTPGGGQEGWNGGEPIAISNPQGGFEQIALLNSAWLEAFGGGAADRRNPFVVGRFAATARELGQGTFSITESGSEFGVNSNLAPFSFDRAALDFGNPIELNEVTLAIDTLTIVPTPSTTIPITLVVLLATRRRRTSERSSA